jgi:hypothetical protein
MYGENTVLVSLRVPESKKDEILDRFYSILIEYNISYTSNIEVKDAVIEKPVIGVLGIPKDKFNQEENDVIGIGKLASVYSEKKSNPADDLLKAPVEKSQNLKNFENLVSDEVSPAMKDFIDEKKAKIAMLKGIASGKDLKSANSFIVEKVPLEEKYDFEENTTLPDIEYRIAIGSKGVAFTDMYDASFIYLKHGHRYFRFKDRKEFDRFIKSEGVIL